ncbi:zinc-finger homeodomain protein 10-like [Momordica charantia]|uniref:Zinc-finger homeodomain protein 10-like n=1 Tax=Momordica charantia TaxID=3673 RepID=A0A6J1C6R0_MOMCH|nr:zinc-finger homeodomain protein 10-like [Momordica charantia]
MEGENSNYHYRECLRNHAASLGSYATDGCGEFTLDDASSPPNHLHCAACGCHRNFHRKLTYIVAPRASASDDALNIDYDRHAVVEYSPAADTGKKRFRTKFTPDQKDKMLAFAEKLGWKLQRKDLDDEIERFCRSVGVTRQVFKVWMHNHKNAFSSTSAASTGNASSLTQ